MLKPLTINYKNRSITLECTHKQTFPPPQMYGATPEDIDVLWKQGRIDQNQYQHLKTWQENCGLMVMGPRCLDCPLALKQNPRPGRPHVIETENWLKVKERIYWEDMKASSAQEETPMEETPMESPIFVGAHDEEFPVPSLVESPQEEDSQEEDSQEEDSQEEAPALDDDLIDFLAND